MPNGNSLPNADLMQALLNAFLRTLYHIHSDQHAYVIRTRQLPPQQIAGFTWALVIADNPQSQSYPTEQNQALRHQLQHSLDTLNLPYWSAITQAKPRDSWPDEHGFLIRLDGDISTPDGSHNSQHTDADHSVPDQVAFQPAIKLARELKQHAIIAFRPNWKTVKLLAISNAMQSFLEQQPVSHCLTTGDLS